MRKDKPFKSPLRSHHRLRTSPVWGVSLLVALVAAVYHTWLIPTLITAGDFPYFTLAHLKEGLALPALWQPAAGTGEYDILGLPMFPIAFAQGLFAHVGIGWVVSERLFWIIPAVAVPGAATYAVSLSLFHRRLAAFIAALAIVTNSYMYILYEGGQFGVAIGYGCMPLVLWTFARGQRHATVNSYVLTGLCMAFQAIYDIRSTYISLGVCLIYALFYRNDIQEAKRGMPWLPLRLVRSIGLIHLAVALLVFAFVHAWWLLPAFFVRAPALPSSYTDVGNLHALSLVNLSDALALFHPFWFANDVRIAPINPLFFLVPLLVFVLLLRSRYDKPVLFLATIALVATFLVKGDNAPYGIVYDWLFVHTPGFSLFRDASKFYQPLTLAYALLLGAIADGVWRVVKGVGGLRRTLLAPVPFCFLALVILPATPALLHQVRGTFAANTVPTDYAQFNSFVDRQRDFFRVLWAPARPRFGTSTNLHPALDADLGSPCCIAAHTGPAGQPWAWLGAPSATQVLRVLSVRYIVVPDATEGDVIGVSGAPTGLSAPPHVVLSSVRTFLPLWREFSIGHLHVFVDENALPLISASPVDTISMCATTIGRCAVGDSVLSPYLMHKLGGPAVSAYTTGTSWYDIPLRATPQPFYIVLSQTYDTRWLAYISPNGTSPWLTLFATPLPAIDHHVINGYANGWLVRKPGSYHVILVYWPERLVLFGICIAVAAVLAYSAVILRGWSRHSWVRRIRGTHEQPTALS